LPFPGWDIPGVLTAGAAQALLAEHGVAVGKRVVVGGTGPFLLPVAAGLAEAGARVVGVFEAGDPRAWLARWRDVAARPSAIGEGAGYLARLARYGIRVVPRTGVVAAHGDQRVEGVTVARLDAGWRAVPGSARRVDCDAVAVGWGFTPRIELAVQAGCATRSGPDGAPLVDVDGLGASSVPGVYAAGELTGVAGAPLALVEGHAAGVAAAAHAAGRGQVAVAARSRARLVRFAAAMHAAHPVRDGWVTWLRPDTLVCRCEEVPLARVDEAIGELGATDPRTVKLLTRCGMGWCQGRICGEAVARLVAVRSSGPADPRAFADRPLATPVRLDALARDREPL
jgi:NADPH-dependent 2,4-dienoyl-CoA reductase/sulfur reductase-like enzyme